MSNNRISGFGESMRSSGGDLQTVLCELGDELNMKLSMLRDLYWGYEDCFKRISCKAEGDQLKELAGQIFRMAEYESLDVVIDLDDTTPQMLDPVYADIMREGNLSEASAGEAISQGAFAGTSACITMIAPVKNELAEAHFLPWRKDLFKRKHYLEQDPYTGESITLGTKIPGIYIDFYYLPGSDFPIRRIFFRKE